MHDMIYGNDTVSDMLHDVMAREMVCSPHSLDMLASLGCTIMP